MTDISNKIKVSSVSFAQFKAFQDLCHRDIAAIFKCSIDDSIRWSNGNAPADITKIALIANYVAERARLRGMSETDIQYFEKQKRELEEEVADLKDTIWDASIKLKKIRLHSDRAFSSWFGRACMWLACVRKDDLT